MNRKTVKVYTIQTTNDVFLKALAKPVQIARGYLHNCIGGSRSLSEASQVKNLRGTTNRLGYTMHPRAFGYIMYHE